MMKRSLLLLALVGAFSGGAQAATIPLIQYKTSNGPDNRRLLFSNNPEEIRADEYACDLADPIEVSANSCAKSLMRIENAVGNFRDWWEHGNKTGKTISYGVRIHNRNSFSINYAVQGIGFVFDGTQRGGQEFIDALLGKGAVAEQELESGESAWIFLSDSATPIGPNKYFTGVVDFSITGGPATIENLAFINTPAEGLGDSGYVQRVIGRVHESLVYKGLASASETHAHSIDFQIDDSTSIGRLPVGTRRFLQPEQHEWDTPRVDNRCEAGSYPLCRGDVGRFSDDMSVSDHWVTHIAPDPFDKNPKRARAVVTDMATILTPGFPSGCHPLSEDAFDACLLFSPFYKNFYADFEQWLYPNWGNWAIHYKMSGSVRNFGDRTRRIHYGIRADGLSPLAFRGQDSVWRQFVMQKSDAQNPNDYLPVSTIVVPGGLSAGYSVELILSGPGAGTLEQFLKVLD